VQDMATGSLLFSVPQSASPCFSFWQNCEPKATAKTHLNHADSVVTDRITLADQLIGYDRRFALIDTEGQYRYAQILKSTFQVGKARAETPTDLVTFARAILVDHKGGRFIRSDKSQRGILKYGRQAAQSYLLDPAIAWKIGVPSRGSM
jgi:hypothetical protein